MPRRYRQILFRACQLYAVGLDIHLQVVDIDFFDTQRFSFGTRWFNFLTLTQVSSKRHHFALIGFLQPAHDHGGIETPRVRQHNLFCRCHNHA